MRAILQTGGASIRSRNSAESNEAACSRGEVFRSGQKISGSAPKLTFVLQSLARRAMK